MPYRTRGKRQCACRLADSCAGAPVFAIFRGRVRLPKAQSEEVEETERDVTPTSVSADCWRYRESGLVQYLFYDLQYQLHIDLSFSFNVRVNRRDAV